jgi:hypothetical protein
MSRIERLIQKNLKRHLSDEYLTWFIYLPTKQINDKWENIKAVLGDSVGSFKGSYPSQKPKQVVSTSEDGDAVLNLTIYKIDIISLTMAITKDHVLRIQNDMSLYQPTVALSDDLIGRNVSLEVQLKK